MLVKMMKSLSLHTLSSCLQTPTPAVHLVHLAGKTGAVWRRKTTVCCCGSSELIEAREDRYDGLIIDSELLSPDPATFAKQLTASLQVRTQQADSMALNSHLPKPHLPLHAAAEGCTFLISYGISTDCLREGNDHERGFWPSGTDCVRGTSTSGNTCYSIALMPVESPP